MSPAVSWSLRSVFFLSALATLTSGARTLLAETPAAGNPAAEDATAHGAALLLPFKRDLMSALTVGLAAGVEEAIQACSTQAPEIAARHSDLGVRVGRASHRLRNPANVAPDWVAPVLDAYLTPGGDLEPRVVELAGGGTGYIEPIMLSPPCLVCHGELIDPSVLTRLADLYPDDQATGFAVGDLRGVFWVEFPRSD